MTQTNTLPQNESSTDSKPKQPWLWRVVLLDDDHHTYEYVIAMMKTVFGYEPEKGFLIAQTVDRFGRAVCTTTHKELAELKRDQIHAFGRDPLMIQCKGSMTAIIEPAAHEDDDAEDRSRDASA
jgi:ATP-dependent Clp protease adaptor protein ClpS